MQRRVNFARHGMTLTVHSCMLMHLHREKVASRKDREQITPFLLLALAATLLQKIDHFLSK
jgi:hypothetical protein